MRASTVHVAVRDMLMEEDELRFCGVSGVRDPMNEDIAAGGRLEREERLWCAEESFRWTVRKL
jgi:hypothetical protein